MKGNGVRCRIVRLPGYIEHSVPYVPIYVGMGSVQAHIGDTAGSVPDHSNNENIATGRVTRIFSFPSVYKS
jgi:hypothetical protein